MKTFSLHPRTAVWTDDMRSGTRPRNFFCYIVPRKINSAKYLIPFPDHFANSSIPGKVASKADFQSYNNSTFLSLNPMVQSTFSCYCCDRKQKERKNWQKKSPINVLLGPTNGIRNIFLSLISRSFVIYRTP